MGAAVGLRLDHGAVDLRRLARASSDSDQVRRLLALAVICAGGSRREAAQVGGAGLQTVRDRVLRFDERGPAGLVEGKAPGARARLNDTQRAALAGIVAARSVRAGPVLAGHGVVRWRVADPVAWVQGRFGITLRAQTMSRALRALGCRKLSARPRHHAQDAGAIADFEKTPRRAGGNPRGPWRPARPWSGAGRSSPWKPPSVRGPWRTRVSGKRPG